ncbi:hypothetical protein TruAng_010193 [Truncatella angustata]|nr:hypothetical protein TruAng_010193 [Truncatella angustata]
MGLEGADRSLLTATAGQLRISATLEINELVRKELANGHKVVHLGFGEATFPLPEEVVDAHRTASHMTSYLPVAGLMRLRESIARFQSRRLNCLINPEQVVVAPGSKPLLFALFDILDGDVLLPRPSWVSYEPQVTHARKRLFWIETDEHDRHTISNSALSSAFDQATSEGANSRIMLINSPSNPTGQAYSDADLERISRFCRNHDITLISDEIYSDICFSEEKGISAGYGSRFKLGKMILTGGLSKTYSAGGWRVGFAIFPATKFGEAVQQAVLAYASECWSAASAPAQVAAAIAFEPSVIQDRYRENVASLHEVCTMRLFHALRDCGLAVAEPKGAFYLYPSFHPYEKQLIGLGIHDSLNLSRWLLQECGIAALPGSAFGENDTGSVGGRYRLRMATSGLYFKEELDRYEEGYDLLASTREINPRISLPLLDEAIVALKDAVAKLKSSSQQ